MGHSATYFDLRDAFAQEGCAVCRLSLAAVEHYLAGINYEGVNDTGVRAETRAALGFCNRHAHQWLSRAHVLGTALIYEEVLSQLAAALEDLSYHPVSLPKLLVRRLSLRRKGTGIPTGLVPTAACPACRMQIEQSRLLVAALVDALREGEFRNAYGDSAGLCLPHLREALRDAPNEEVFRTLRDHALSYEKRLGEHLRGVIRKHDYRYRDEPSREEREAAARSVAHVAGALGIR